MNIFQKGNKQYIDSKSASEILGVTQYTLYSVARHKTLKTIRFGKYILFDYEQVMKCKDRKRSWKKYMV